MRNKNLEIGSRKANFVVSCLITKNKGLYNRMSKYKSVEKTAQKSQSNFKKKTRILTLQKIYSC